MVSTLNPTDEHAHRFHFHLYIDDSVAAVCLWSHFSASFCYCHPRYISLSFATLWVSLSPKMLIFIGCWYFGVDVNSINSLLTTCFAFFGQKWKYFSVGVVDIGVVVGSMLFGWCADVVASFHSFRISKRNPTVCEVDENDFAQFFRTHTIILCFFRYFGPSCF